ncbi:MAG: transposase [Sphingopyxis sp.]|nr:transposase [Sphingopyxis sp.]
MARAGTTWRDLHSQFREWSSVYRQFRRWRRRGSGT